jgi:dTMP kinase
VVVFVRYLMGTAYLPRRLYPWGYRFFTKLLPVPRRLILVDVDPEVACKRIRNRTHAMEVFENLSSLIKIRSRMIELSEGRWSIVDNNRSEHFTIEQVRRTIEEWDESMGEGGDRWPFL